jgi:heme-degrading monooxygenase HmoA
LRGAAAPVFVSRGRFQGHDLDADRNRPVLVDPPEPVGISRETVMSEKGVARQPTIARIWRGRTRREQADEYEVYNYEVGIRPLIEKALGVQTFREDRADETEFMTISYWASREAMAAFTGGDPTRIHHLERDAEFLIELPESVQILEIRASHGRIGGDGP